MLRSFTTKLGVLLLTLILSLVLALLSYFYYYTQSNLLSDLKRAIGDVTRTASFVFDEEQRERVAAFKQLVFSELPNDSQQVLSQFDNSTIGETQRLLSYDLVEIYQNKVEFQYIVQLLRRIQAGSRNQQDKLNLLSQSNIQSDNASRVAWAYLLVKLPGQKEHQSLMFLADSNYEIDSVSPDGNPVGNLYRAASFFFAPFNGDMGIADDWYTDEFGTVLSAAVPIYDENGGVIAVLGIDYNVASFQERINQQKWMGGGLLIVAVLFAVIMTSIIVFTVSMPLSKLKQGAEQLLQKNFKFKVSLNNKDEFGLLATSMNQVSDALDIYTRDMDSLVLERTKELEGANQQVVALNQKLQAENQALGGEVEDTRELRQNSSCSGKHSFGCYQLESRFIAGSACGGDIWFTNPDSHEVVGHFGTVSGYGLDVSVLAMQIKALLAIQTEHSAMALVNQFLYQHFQGTSVGGMANILQIHVSDENHIVLQGTGNPPILFDSNESINVLDIPSSAASGVNASWDTPQSLSLVLANNQCVLLYSDGFLQALLTLYGFEHDITPSNIVEWGLLTSQSLEDVFTRFEEQDWLTDFAYDISAVLITKPQQ